MAMESKIMTITPELAKELLENNMPRNRRLSTQTVDSYARIMKAGGWNLTHQGIAFDNDGILVDGQHRLNAVIKANVPVRMMVTTGVEHHDGEAFNIDVGLRRSVLNIMQISGVEDAVYTQMARYIMAYMKWKMPAIRKAEAAEVMAYIERHYSDVAALYDIIKPKTHAEQRRINAMVGAALLAALYRGEDYRKLQAFCDVYRRNDVSNCQDCNPRHALNLKDYIRDHKQLVDVYDRCESAIYAFCNNRASLHIRGNCYPYNAAMDA